MDAAQPKNTLDDTQEIRDGSWIHSGIASNDFNLLHAVREGRCGRWLRPRGDGSTADSGGLQEPLEAQGEVL